MLNNRVIPLLLLNNNGLYKTIKFKNPIYIGDPINTVKIFNEKEVDEIVILDFRASLENRYPNFKLIKNIVSEAFIPISYGGGIKTIEDASKLFNLGIEKIVINSNLFENINLVTELSSKFGSSSIVVCLDIKKNILGNYSVYSHSGRKNTFEDPVKIAIEIEHLGAGELIINSIDRDGTMDGYDLNIIKKITSKVNIPVIACGGAGKLSDFKDAITIGGADAVCAGSLFVYYGAKKGILINYPTQDELNNFLMLR